MNTPAPVITGSFFVLRSDATRLFFDGTNFSASLEEAHRFTETPALALVQGIWPGTTIIPARETPEIVKADGEEPTQAEVTAWTKGKLQLFTAGYRVDLLDAAPITAKPSVTQPPMPPCLKAGISAAHALCR